MATTPKFLAIRYDDVQRYLGDDQRRMLLEIIRTLNAQRTANSKPTDVLFTLSGRDKYAQVALEAYVTAVQNDPDAVRHDGALAAMRAAQDVRQQGLLAGPQRMPS